MVPCSRQFSRLLPCQSVENIGFQKELTQRRFFGTHKWKTSAWDRKEITKPFANGNELEEDSQKRDRSGIESLESDKSHFETHLDFVIGFWPHFNWITPSQFGATGPLAPHAFNEIRWFIKMEIATGAKTLAKGLVYHTTKSVHVNTRTKRGREVQQKVSSTLSVPD